MVAWAFYGQKGLTTQKCNLKAPEPSEGKQSENQPADFKTLFLKKRLSELAETLNNDTSTQDQPWGTHQTLELTFFRPFTAV